MTKGWIILLSLFLVPILTSGLLLLGSGKQFHLPHLKLEPKNYQAPFTLLYGDCNHPLVGSVKKNSRAWTLGLRPGQKVVRINKLTAGFLNGGQITEIINSTQPESLTLELQEPACSLLIPLEKLPEQAPPNAQAEADAPEKSLVMSIKEESEIKSLPCFLKHQLKDGPLVIEIYRGNTRKFLPLTKLIAHLNRQTLEKCPAAGRGKLLQLMQLDCDNQDLNTLLESLNLKHNSYALFLEAGSQEYIKARDIIKVGNKELPIKLAEEQLERLLSQNSRNVGNLKIAPGPTPGL